MIAASDPQEFVPRGRQQALRHPGPTDQIKKKINDSECNILNKLEKVSLSVDSAEQWILRKTPLIANSIKNDTKVVDALGKSGYTSELLDDSSKCEVSKFGRLSTSKIPSRRTSLENEAKNESRSFDGTVSNPSKKNNQSSIKMKLDLGYMEDELYIKGQVAIWSRGLATSSDNDNARTHICSYTLPNPIKQGIWANFHCIQPSFNAQHVDSTSGTVTPAICLSDTNTIRAYTNKGEEFVIPVPFPIGQLWSTKFGIFIEKDLDNFELNNGLYDCNATLYSLAYPLDDICPVVLNQLSLTQILNSSNLKLVFVSEEPSICMMFDSQNKTHNVYYIRKILDGDFGDKLNVSQFTANASARLKTRLSMWDNLMNASNLFPPSSPVSLKPGGQLQSRSHSSMATMSRCHSLAESPCSPWVSHTSQFNYNVSSLGNKMKYQNNSFFNCSKSMSHLRSSPTVCLDFLWSDYSAPQDGSLSGPASKVFLSDDLTGQWYLCYLLPLRFQLSIVKVDFSGSTFSFGLSTSISAKDAVPIPHLHMLAILEHSGNVTLYSGLTEVGKLHIGGTLAKHTPSPYVRRNLHQFNSPFPRRSSLLPHCSSADPKFDEHLLSPVLPTGTASNTLLHIPENPQKSVLNGLSDPIENRFTLKYSDGTYYRVTLPLLASSALVEDCLNALKQFLQRDASITLFTRWYAVRNVLGSKDLTLEQEWYLFEGLLFELLGYEDEQADSSKEVPITPGNVKRQKSYSQGTEADWKYLMESDHSQIKSNLLTMLNLPGTGSSQITSKANLVLKNKSVLFAYINIVHFVLHVLYEDLKLNTLRSSDLRFLAKFLNKLSNDLGLIEYSMHYFKDFPKECSLSSGRVSQGFLKDALNVPGLGEGTIDVMKQINALISNLDVGAYPYLQNVNTRSRDIVRLIGMLSETKANSARSFIKDFSHISYLEDPDSEKQQASVEIDTKGSRLEQVVLLMVKLKITRRWLDTLPVAVNFILYDALWKCRENPPSDWPAAAYLLLYREDLAAHVEKIDNEKAGPPSDKYGMYSNSQLREVLPSIKQEIVPNVKQECDILDGMEDIDNPLMKLRFAEDIRVAEARKMLQSSKPVPIVLVQRPDVSDHDFIEEQEKHLYAICTRTMALPVGRGMFTLRTVTPVITEPLTTPQLCLTGKVPPRGTTVELTHIDTPSNMSLWPLFHNGVANGLRVTPDAHNIDNTWIIFNKPKGGVDQQMEYAGFLMALGLNGHLKNLAVLSTYDYLVKLHEMTSVGILLGLSAAFRGTSNVGLTKTLSIHLEGLLPPTAMELDVPQTLQVASLLGIGLVYQGTAHRHITEVLLCEIGRPPGPEMENCIDRESYSLAAGLALGLVTLKHGCNPVGLSDLNVPDVLHYYMVGGNVRPFAGSQKDKYKVPSFQIREGTSVNLDVTAPGSTLALGLMYMGTGNRAIADWMAPPATQYLLDFVRPDFLMLRILSRSLILWDNIEPTKKWVDNQVPATIRPFCMVTPSLTLDIDYEAMNQAYCNIVTGACMAIGLKYAGSAHPEAFETLLYYCHMFTSLTGKSIAELAGRPTIETCLNVLLLSAAIVMAGTGNLEIMRLVRHLRKRVGVSTSAVVTYGSHLATHMALGLLFLGGGRYTLSNSPASIAALICAIYPKFPTHSNDNRYHLQAFRHLYVLAAEPRLIIPKDVNLYQSCYANLQVVKLDGTSISMRGPSIIPDLNTLFKVSIEDERYWPVVFERGRNWDLLIKILSTTGYVDVKQRAGCLDYIVDKFGYHSQLARTLTQSEVGPWDPSSNAITSFTSKESIKSFVDHFLHVDIFEANVKESKFRNMLTKMTYDAVIKDKLVTICIFTSLYKTVQDLEHNPSAMNIYQLKLILRHVENSSCLFSKEVVLALQYEVKRILDGWEMELKSAVKDYLAGNKLDYPQDVLSKLSVYVTFYDLPYKIDTCNMVELLSELQNSNMSDESIVKLIQFCNS